jgi:hypothetical protein
VASLATILLTASQFAASAALFVAGLCMAAVYPTTLGVLSGRFASMSGTAIGLAVTAGWFGSFAVSPTFGFVAQATTFGTGYFIIIGIAAVMLLMAVLLSRQEQAKRAVQAGTAAMAAK